MKKELAASYISHCEPRVAGLAMTYVQQFLIQWKLKWKIKNRE